ncbi:MAG: hypothetical protein R2715_07430 [Ilumatobacteraceae bacterium]
MFFWFLGAGMVAVWNVFHDPRFDIRLLALGLLLPDLIDGPLGGARFMHSVTASVVLMIVLVLATIGRRPLRKHLLAVPIGTFLHLVLDGAFNDTRAFWWPFSGLSLPDGGLPSLERPLWLNVVLELCGLLMLRWFWRRFSLADPEVRHRLFTTGALPGARDPQGATC